MSNAPIIKGPAAFNLNHPEPFRWRTAVNGWLLTVTGAGDSSFDGTYAARTADEAAGGIYRMVDRDDRYLNYVNDYGSIYWCMGGSQVTYMPGDYYREGSLEDGPPEGEWHTGYNSGPGPTVTRVLNTLTGVFRWQTVPAGEDAEPDAGAWSEGSTEAECVPAGLSAGDYVLFVQEQIDGAEWTDAGSFAFSASVFMLPAPIISGPVEANTTFARFNWTTGKSHGWRFTVNGFAAYSSYYAPYDGVYEPYGDTPGVYKHIANPRYLFFNPVWSSYYGRYYNYWVFNESPHSGTYNSPAYCEGGTLESGPQGAWYGDMGPGVTPILSREDMIGLTGVYKYRLLAEAAGTEIAASEGGTELSALFGDLAPGVYRLLVNEKVDDTEWTETGEFTCTVVRNPISAPRVTGFTPTDIFAPTLYVNSNAPGPDRFVAYNAGTQAANGTYAKIGTLNDFPLFKRIDANVYCFNGREYESRLWAIYGDGEWVPQSNESYDWSYPRWYYNHNSIDNFAGPTSNNWNRIDSGQDPSPTLIYGSYADGQGTGQFQYRVDGGEWSGSFSGGEFTIPEQTPGTHIVEVRELGENGVWSQTSTAFSLETTLIPAPNVTGPDESDGGWHCVLGWSPNSGNRGVRVYRYRMNNGPWSPDWNVGNDNGQTLHTVARLLDGDNYFDVQEKSNTGGWSHTGTKAIHAFNALPVTGGGLKIPDGCRIVVMDEGGREYLWRSDTEQLRLEYTPLTMPDPS